jgi:hypothetical protein
MARRRSRKRQRGWGIRIILIIALVLLIAGFITRRMLIPTHNSHHSEPQRFGAAAADLPAAPNGLRARPAPASAASVGEHLNAADRRELDALIRSKTR